MCVLAGDKDCSSLVHSHLLCFPFRNVWYRVRYRLVRSFSVKPCMRLSKEVYKLWKDLWTLTILNRYSLDIGLILNIDSTQNQWRIETGCIPHWFYIDLISNRFRIDVDSVQSQPHIDPISNRYRVNADLMQIIIMTKIRGRFELNLN